MQQSMMVDARADVISARRSGEPADAPALLSGSDLLANSADPVAAGATLAVSVTKSSEDAVLTAAAPIDAIAGLAPPPSKLLAAGSDLTPVEDGSLPGWVQDGMASGAAWSPNPTERPGAVRLQLPAPSRFADDTCRTGHSSPAMQDAATPPPQEGEAIHAESDPHARSSAIAPDRFGDLFPISSLLGVVAMRERAGFDASMRRLPATGAGDVRSQWQSVDAWAALQQGLLSRAAGVDAQAHQAELGLHLTAADTPARASLHAQAQHIDSVVRFKLAELA